MKNRIKLVEIEGSTSIHIYVEITDGGDLLLSGQDLGEAPQMIWGDSDYEYWLRIKNADKEAVLLALIEKHYSGNASVVTELREYLESKEIPCEFHSYA